MKKLRAMIGMILIFLCLGCGLPGCTKEPIRCYIDYINPETGESLAYETGMQYKEVHFAYNNTTKYLVPVIKRYDNDKQVNALKSYTTKITKINPNSDIHIYDLPYMAEKGEYRYWITDLEYDDEKYHINDWGESHVTVYID